MKITVEDLFKKAGVSWTSMKENESFDISDKDIKIKSFNNITGEVEYKRVLTLVRKEDSSTRRVSNSKNIEMFRASSAHKVMSLIDGSWEYRPLSLLGTNFIGLDDKGREQKFLVEKTGKVEPILDFQVEDNCNYFANGVLSHNTTPGGMALKYYSSIRLETRKVDNITNKDSIDGMVIRIKSIKNKTAMPFKKREVKLLFGKGFQVEDEYVEIAIEQAIIKKGGPWYTIDEDTKLQGKDAVIEYYRENPSKYKELVNLVNQIMFNSEKIEIKEEEPVVEDQESEEIPASLELSNVKEIIPEDPPKRRGRPKKEENVVDVNDELLDEEDLELSEETVKVLA